jgi:hypothetical protein
MNTTRAKAERWVLAVVLATQMHTVCSDESHAAAAAQQSAAAQASSAAQQSPAAQASSAAEQSPAAQASSAVKQSPAIQASSAARPLPAAQGSPAQPAAAGPLPLTCEAPVTKDSGLALRIELTEDASKKVVFDHSKLEGLPTGVLGQTKICTCVDNEGNLRNPVKLVRASGSPQLDAEATEIGKTISYPAGHPGCMHQTVNFSAP